MRTPWTLVLAAACGPAPETDSNADSDAPRYEDTDDADTNGDGCPEGMAAVDTTCVDQVEARLLEWDGVGWLAASPFETVAGRRVRAAIPSEGHVPQGYISATEAAAACAEAGKRLCDAEEWARACGGASETQWPYGDTHQEGACNDAYDGHPVVDYFGTATDVWDEAHLNDPGINQQPGTIAAGRAFTACASDASVFDLHGNLNEWIADPEGTLRGGFYADGSLNGAGCSYVTTAHDTAWHDYSTGFRCCVDRAR